MQNLAKTNPQMQGLDFSNMSKTAEELYSRNGQDINQAKASIKSSLDSFINP